MPIGKVKWFDDVKGYGFITLPDSTDIFVHYNSIIAKGYRSLKEGQEVEFEIKQNGPKLYAENVTVIAQAKKRRFKSNSFKEPNQKYSESESVESVKGQLSEHPAISNERHEHEKLSSKDDEAFTDVTAASNFYLAQALLAKQSREHERARALFEQAIEYEPSLQAFYSYAAMEKELRNYDSARRVFQRGISTFPNRGKLYEDYGVLERKLGDAEQAIKIFREGLKNAPGHRMLHRVLGETLTKLGGVENFAEADKHLETARKAGVLEASDYQYKLVKVLIGHPRGRQALDFIQQAGFSVIDIKLDRIKRYIIEFIIRPMKPEYVEAYDLADRILVRCILKNSALVEDVDNLLNDVKNQEYLQVNQDVLFIILQDSNNLRNYLYKLLESAGKNPTIVPIADQQTLYGITNSDSESILKQILDEWLYRRNLYDERFPVSGRRFFGREHELLGLIRSIDSGSPSGLFGLRKVGKTSLLKKLREKRSQDIVIYVDLQAVPAGVKDCDYLYWEMAEQLRKELKAKYPDLEKSIEFTLGGLYGSYFTVTDKSHIPSQFDSDLRIVRNSLLASNNAQSVKIVVLLDELETMLPSAHSRGFKGYIEFFAYLRGMAQQEGFLISIVTGANPAICDEPQWEGRDNPVFKFYQETFLPPLERHECDEMISKLGRGMGINYTDNGFRRIYAETGGHPFITRQLCSRISKHFRKRPLRVDVAIVEQGTQEFLFHDSDTFREILYRLDRDFPKEKELLLAIANGVSKETELMKLSASGTYNELRHLVGYQLIIREDKEYRYKMGLMLKWVRRHWLNKEN